jgi:nitric oxide synthase oxygenase domain/subunit
MNKKLASVFNSIYFETEMLEAHEWNEQETSQTLKKISDYFSVTTKKDLDLVKIDLGLIFSETVCDIIFKYIDALFIEIVNKGESGEA